jgi:hypothetical protein
MANSDPPLQRNKHFAALPGPSGAEVLRCLA